MADPLSAISQLDGRYSEAVIELANYFSESALIRYRVRVEVEYLIALGNENGILKLPPFSKIEQATC